MLKRLVTTMLATSMALYPLVFIRATPQADESTAGTAQTGLSADQIDNLMAPIALYPDPLLAQMLPASTYVDQIDQAARYLRSHNNQATGVDNQNWDVSVKSIAHYPEVVFKMSEKLDWTTAVGQVYVTQTADVFNSVQRLRAKAQKYGYLKTTPQQTVIVEKEVIKVVPAQPQYIYVPTYNPQVVYVAAPSSGPSTGAIIATAAITFTSGLLIGAWLNNDCNWYSHSVYYHGWHGVGWVSHSASVVHWNNSYYVNSRYSTVHYNTAVINRNVNYSNINRYTNVSRNVSYNNVNLNVNNFNRAAVNNVNLNRNVNLNAVSNTAYRGRTTATTTAARTRTAVATQRSSGFSGYGSGAQTRVQSQRGQLSRSSATTTTRSRSATRSTRSVGVRRRG